MLNIKKGQVKNKLTKFQISELKGAAKVLDLLWTGSYYTCGPENSKRIEGEMIYLFGEDWTTAMYKLVGNKGSARMPYIKPLFKKEAVRKALMAEGE
jgi:hypothetical protein